MKFGFSYSSHLRVFRFPTTKDLLSRWKQFAEKPDHWQPSRLSAICSNHFALTTFRNIKSKHLKSSAIPTIKTPVVEFNVDEFTARDIDRKRPRETPMATRKPVFIHSSDLFPEHFQKKIKIPTEYINKFPPGGYGSRRIKIPKEYEEVETVPESVQEPPRRTENDELFFAQFLQPINDSSNEEELLKEEPEPDLVYQQEQEYEESMEVLADETAAEVPEEYFEEIPMESYCRLCGQICEELEPFAENELIQQMINKCFQTTTIQPVDGLSSDICGTCLNTVQSFSQFSDDVLSIQKQLEEKFLISDGVVQVQEVELKEETQAEEMFALGDGSNDNFQE